MTTRSSPRPVTVGSKFSSIGLANTQILSPGEKSRLPLIRARNRWIRPVLRWFRAFGTVSRFITGCLVEF